MKLLLQFVAHIAGLVSLDELGWCNVNEYVSSWHGMGQYPGAQQQCYCLPCEPPWTNPVWDSSPSGLASWTLVVTALLKFLTISASAVLTSDETLVSITWLRCWLEFQQVRLLSVRGHLSATGVVEQCVTTWFLQSVDLSSV